MYALTALSASSREQRQVPVDGEVSVNVGKSVNYSDTDNTVRVAAKDLMPEGAVPEVVTYTVSSGGGFGKFTGAFGLSSAAGYYQSPDTAVFSDASNLTLTWFVPAQAKNYYSEDGEFVLGYWWSDQPSVTLDSVSVKYSIGGRSAVSVPDTTEKTTVVPSEGDSDFRTASEIVSDIKVGWNLGNTLESYNTNKTGLNTETGWGNPKTTKEMITAVKNAGFNAVRVPVTWGEHMDGDIESRATGSTEFRRSLTTHTIRICTLSSICTMMTISGSSLLIRNIPQTAQSSRQYGRRSRRDSAITATDSYLRE